MDRRLDRRLDRRGWSIVAALSLVAAVALVVAAPARAETVPDWICRPQLEWFSPGGPSMGGSDGLPTVLAPVGVDGGPDITCAGNAASGLSIAKPGDTWALAGTGLAGLRLRLDRVPVALTVATDTLVEFVLPPRADGEHVVEITEPSGRVYANGAVIYRTPGPAVTRVTDLTRAGGATGGASGGASGGAAGDEFLVTGARLFEATIRINDQPVPIVRGSNTAVALRFALPPLPPGPDGRYHLDVSSYSGVTSTTFLAGAPRPAGPVITSLENDDHANLTDGYAGASMTVRGWGLTGSQVRVGGVAARVTANFDDVLIFVMPPHAPGEVDVVVSGRLGSVTTGSGYLDPFRLPTITSVTGSGTAGASGVVHAGTQVVVTGSHLRSACLTVDDVLQNDQGQVLSASDSRIVFRIGAHPAARDVPLRIVTGTGRAVAFLTYDLPLTAPVLSGLLPGQGSTAGGEIRVRGSGFSPLLLSAAADGRAVPAAYVDPSTLKVLLPRHAAGLGTVTVTAGNARRSTTVRFNYRYVAAG